MSNYTPQNFAWGRGGQTSDWEIVPPTLELLLQMILNLLCISLDPYIHNIAQKYSVDV